MHSNIFIGLSCYYEWMMFTQPALAAHATTYHNFGFKRSALWMGCWELYRYLASLASITLLQNTRELNCYYMLLLRLSSELQFCFEVYKKWNVQCICVCCFALASVTYQSKSKVAAVRWFVFYLCGFFLSRCFTFPHQLVCTLQRHHPKLSNPQPTKAPGGDLTKTYQKAQPFFKF